MSRIGIETSAFDSPQLLRAGADGCHMWVEAICWCSRQGRIRAIPREWAQARFPRRWKRIAAKLVLVGLFAEHADGYELVENGLWRFFSDWATWDKSSYPEVRARDGEACRYCGGADTLTIDHVVPRSQGGTDHAANLVVCCRSCNSRKGGRTPEQAGMRLRPVQLSESGESVGPTSSSASNDGSDQQ